MKEPAFVMKMMATYGDMEVASHQEKTRRFYTNDTGDTIRREFNYTTVYANHFMYRHIVDDHNKFRHSLPSLEDTCVMQRWENHGFAFILAVTKVNAYNTLLYFIWKQAPNPPTLHQFRRNMALSIIKNDLIRGSFSCERKN